MRLEFRTSLPLGLPFVPVTISCCKWTCNFWLFIMCCESHVCKCKQINLCMKMRGFKSEKELIYLYTQTRIPFSMSSWRIGIIVDALSPQFWMTSLQLFCQVSIKKLIFMATWEHIHLKRKWLEYDGERKEEWWSSPLAFTVTLEASRLCRLHVKVHKPDKIIWFFSALALNSLFSPAWNGWLFEHFLWF